MSTENGLLQVAALKGTKLAVVVVEWLTMGMYILANKGKVQGEWPLLAPAFRD